MLLLTLMLAAPASGGAEDAEIHLVPFSHLDLFWAGTREECLARGNDIIAKAIRSANESPKFRFLLEDNVFVANYLDTHRGAREAEDLKRLVREGRIEISPKWAAIYQDLPDGEALARNLAIGKRYARTVFGVEPQVAHMGDIPGYTPQFPQLLQQAGLPYMLMARMGPSDKSLFYWKSPDGSRALVWSSLKSYAWGCKLRLHSPARDEKVRGLFQKDVADVQATTPGPIFMHFGSDLWAPPADLVQRVEEFNAWAPARLAFSTPTEYFRRAVQTPGIPELSGEIPSSWPNLISSLANIWPGIIPATNTLVNAEKFAALAHAAGYAAYPAADFERMWKALLESMDHNQDGQGGMAGDVRKIEYQQVALLGGGQILRDSLRDFAERVEVPFAGSFPIVVFNPQGWTRDDLVQTRVALYGDANPAEITAFRKGLRLLDAEGRSVPFHVIEYSENISRTLDMVFVAHGVPSLGYKTYYLVAAEQADEFPPAAKVKLDSDNDLRAPRRPLGSDVLENRFYRLTIDKATGRVALFDKELGREVCRDMEIAALEERGGNYIGIEPLSGRTIPSLVDGVAVEENSAVRAVARIDVRIGDILITQRLTLYRELKRLDIENTVDWPRARFVRVRQVIPMLEPSAAIHYGVPFGAGAAGDILPNSGPHLGDEITQDSWRRARLVHDWVHVGGGDWGLAIATDHQQFRLEDGAICAEMVRGTRFTSAKVVRGDQVGSMHYPPPGRYVFRYSLSSAPGDWRRAKAYRAGIDWNNPLLPVTVVDTVTAKSLPPERSFCTLSADNLVLSALKKADEGGSLVLRAYEIEGRPAATPVELFGRKASFHEANVLEEVAGAAPCDVLRAEPYKIKTITLDVNLAPGATPNR